MLDGESLCQNGVIEKYIADNLIGCSFSVNYNGNEYEIGYSTYKCSKDSSADEKFTTKQDYLIKSKDGNYFSMNIGGYHFYIKALGDNYDDAKEFVNNLSVGYETIEQITE